MLIQMRYFYTYPFIEWNIIRICQAIEYNFWCTKSRTGFGRFKWFYVDWKSTRLAPHVIAPIKSLVYLPVCAEFTARPRRWSQRFSTQSFKKVFLSKAADWEDPNWTEWASLSLYTSTQHTDVGWKKLWCLKFLMFICSWAGRLFYPMSAGERSFYWGEKSTTLKTKESTRERRIIFWKVYETTHGKSADFIPSWGSNCGKNIKLP